MNTLELVCLIAFSVAMFFITLAARMVQAKIAPVRLERFMHGRRRN